MAFYANYGRRGQRMKQIVTCKEMKALDGNMIEGIGIPSCVLMERAALKVAEELERTLADKKQEERILCVCGSGNNGGDGVAVARILKLHGYRTSLYLVGNPDHRTVEMQRQLDIMVFSVSQTIRPRERGKLWA